MLLMMINSKSGVDDSVGGHGGNSVGYRCC